MEFFIALLLLPLSIILVKTLNKYNVTKKKKIIYNTILIVVSFIYMFFSLKYEKLQLGNEMVGIDDYIFYGFLIIFISPFLWVYLFYLFKKIFKNNVINKKNKFKSKEEFLYYRDDLGKISPSIVMYTSNLELDSRKCVASSLLELKLSGFISSDGNSIKKNNRELLSSEKMLLNTINYNDLNVEKYEKLVEKETIDNGYLKKNTNNVFIKLFRIVAAVLIAFSFIFISDSIDNYTFKTYKLYQFNGKEYLLVKDDIGYIGYGKIANIEDYYHGEVNGVYFYDTALISMNNYKYKEVVYANIFHLINFIVVIISLIVVILLILYIINEIKFFNKEYKRTAKGTELVNKAYGLKNFLKDFSIIDKRNEEELILWEYYLIYAVALGINVKLEDSLIDKYFN